MKSRLEGKAQDRDGLWWGSVSILDHPWVCISPAKTAEADIPTKNTTKANAASTRF